VLDDGRLLGSHGRAVDFRDAVIAMTAHRGSEAIQAEADGRDYEPIQVCI